MKKLVNPTTSSLILLTATVVLGLTGNASMALITAIGTAISGGVAHTKGQLKKKRAGNGGYRTNFNGMVSRQ